MEGGCYHVAMRVIRSTIDEEPGTQEAQEALERVLTHAVRETYDLDRFGYPENRIALIPYTWGGDNLWAVVMNCTREEHWQDTPSLDEAIEAYEKAVREITARTWEDGEEEPPWHYTDLPDIPAREHGSATSATAEAWMIEAERAHKRHIAAQKTYQDSTRQRQIAFAKAVDARNASQGSGGVAALAARCDLTMPTVSNLAAQGRKIIREKQ